MSLPWFRMYAEFAGDPVVQSLAFEDQRHFVVLLCLKCDGTLDRPIKGTTRERIICRGLGLDPVAASEVKRRLLDVDLINKDWHPCAWDRRQFVSDNSTERVRKHRKLKQTGNVTETAGNRFGNGPDTDTDTDTENTPPTPPRGAGEPARFAEFWKAYPKKVERKKALAIWKRRKLDTLADKIVADVTRRVSGDDQWVRGFVPNPTTYLNGDRWEDQPPERTREITLDEVHMAQGDPERHRELARAYLRQEREKPTPSWMLEGA